MYYFPSAETLQTVQHGFKLLEIWLELLKKRKI